MNGRRETGNEQPSFGAGKNLIEFAADGAFAGGVATALNVGRILQKCEYAFFAVLGKGMKIEKTIVGGGGIYFEIASVNDHTERGVNGQRNAIHQTVSDLDRMDSKRTDLESLTRPNLVQMGVVQQSMLVEFVFYISQSEFSAPDWHV